MVDNRNLSTAATKFITALAKAIQEEKASNLFSVHEVPDEEIYAEWDINSKQLPAYIRVLFHGLKLYEDLSKLEEAGYIKSVQESNEYGIMEVTYMVLPTAFDLEAHSAQPFSNHSFVFLSHAHEDLKKYKNLFINLSNNLRHSGFALWIDTENLPYGVDWRHEIDTAIRSSLALIVIVTPQARNSEYVTYEWSFAVGAKIPIIPILVEGEAMHPRLETLQYMKVSELEETEPYGARLINHLKTLQSSVK